MTVIQPAEKSLDLDYIYEGVLQAIETENFTQALTLAQKGKQVARYNSLEEWVNQFEELRLQIEVALHVDDLDDEFNEDIAMNVVHDFTVLKGIGPSAAQKLANAGFLSIQQLARSEPQEVASIKGFGLATATKLIEDAKTYLQTQNINVIVDREIWKPASSHQGDIGTKSEEATLITPKKLVEGEEPTPYQKLLDREPSSLNSVQDAIKVEIGKEHVIKDLDELEEEDDDELPKDSIKQNSWFDTRYQYSRLTGVQPPKSKSNTQDVASIEPPLMYGKNYEEPEERTQNKDTTRVIEPYPPIVNDYSDASLNIDKNNLESIIPEFGEPEATSSSHPKTVPSLSKAKSAPQIGIAKEVEKSLKEQGYHLIPNYRFHSINHLAYKIIPLEKNIRLFLLLPVRIENQEGMLVVSENRVKSQIHQNSDIHSVQELLDCRDIIFHDIISEGSFFQFLNKYLNLHLAVEKSVEQKRLYLTSDQLQYKIFIEPILLTKETPHFMEKTIPFAYQHNTNLHVAHNEDLLDLLEFLESKYEILETHIHKKTTIQQYQDASSSFNYKLRLTSFLVLGYTSLLFIMFITHWFYLLRVFLNIGYAVVGIYLFAMIYIYYRFYLVKKALATQFETPYYQQEVRLEEADWLVLKEEYPENIMIQFDYECLGKPEKYHTLNIRELFSKHNIPIEPEDECSVTNEPQKLVAQLPNTEIFDKYRSFFED